MHVKNGKQKLKIRERAVMTPSHPRWREFAARLSSAVGEHGCDAESCRLARAILGRMGGFDVQASVEYFNSHDGYCDCEVLWNVDR